MVAPDDTVEPVWSSAPSQIVPSLAQSNSCIVFPARHSKLVALDLLTGQERWQANSLNIWGTLALTNERAYHLN